MEEMLKRSMLTAAHLGVVNRFVNNLLNADSLIEVSELIAVAVSEFGISGVYWVKANGGFHQYQTDENVSPELVAQLIAASFGTTRIAVSSNSMHIRFKHFVLSVCLDANVSDPEVLQDTLAIFGETASRGIGLVSTVESLRLDSLSKSKGIKVRLEKNQAELANLCDSLIAGQKEFNEYLLLKFVSMFPVIGLEPDQEEKILSVIAEASGRLEQQAIHYLEVVGETDDSLKATVSHLDQESFNG